jgi:hypothetical protein
MTRKDPEATRTYDRAYSAAYRAAHPEKVRASQAAYRAAHREEVLAKGRAYAAARIMIDGVRYVNKEDAAMALQLAGVF